MTRLQSAESLARALPGLVAQGWSNRHHAQLAGSYQRIYLYHTRKTGGTSITNAILSLGGESPEDVKARVAGSRPRATRTGGMVVAAHDRLALSTGWYTYGWSHIPAWRLQLRARTYTVTVLRDPVSRVVSLYRYLADPDSDRGRPFGAPAEERALAAGGFDRFLDALPKQHLLNHLHMFSARLDPAEAAERINACTLVVQLEDLGRGVSTLSDVLGRPLPVRNDRRSSMSFELSDLERERLREMLSPEYALMERLALPRHSHP